MKIAMATRLGFERAGRSRNIILQHAQANHRTVGDRDLRNDRLPKILEWLDRSFDKSLPDDERSHARQMVLSRCRGEAVPGVEEYLRQKDERERRSRVENDIAEHRRRIKSGREQGPSSCRIAFDPNSLGNRKHVITNEFIVAARRMYIVEGKTVSEISKETGESRYYVEVALKRRS